MGVCIEAINKNSGLTKHGIYFTIEKSEIFRFVLTNGAENMEILWLLYLLEILVKSN